MNKPTISVVMCTYNTEKYISKAIESVLAQTHSNFEFIIWDDGSTDRTKEIIETFKDERIRYIYHENTGLGMALKLACAEAKGKYIARMDSDDVCLPERLANEFAFLETHKEYVLVSSSVYYIDENGKNIGRSFVCTDDIVLKKILSISNMIVHPMVMMRRDAYEKAGGYVPVSLCEDRIFWSRLAKQGKFYNIISPLGYYRILQNSLSHSINPYNEVLCELRQKMILDDTIGESDIKWYNDFYNYSRPYTIKSKKKGLKRKKTTEEMLFSIFSPILGQILAEKIIVKIKNNYYRWILKNI